MSDQQKWRALPATFDQKEALRRWGITEAPRDRGHACDLIAGRIDRLPARLPARPQPAAPRGDVYHIWDPALGEGRGAAMALEANTPKQAALRYAEHDYRADPRAPEERTLEVERERDLLRWTVRLEPRVMVTWSGTATPRAAAEGTS